MPHPIPEESFSETLDISTNSANPHIVVTPPSKNKSDDFSIAKGPRNQVKDPIFETPDTYRPHSKVSSKMGSQVRIVVPPQRSLSRSSSFDTSHSFLRVNPRSNSAHPRLMSSTPRSVRDLRSKCPSQKDLINMVRSRRSRKRRANGSANGSISYSSIRSPYASTLNFSNYKSPYGFRSPYSSKSRSRSVSGFSTPANGPRSPRNFSGRETPTITEYPGRNTKDGSFDLNATLMNMSIASRDQYGRSVSRISRENTSILGQSRVSLNLSGNISIDLQAPRHDAPTPLEVAHPAKENLRRARLMSRLILGLAQGSYSKLDQYFHKFDLESSYGKKVVTQRSPNVFDVRLFLKNPMPSGYFEVRWSILFPSLFK